jgi:glycosyltransferase involved in cell wall biosynthesis
LRIGIEAKVLTVRAGGIGRYAMQLVQALLAVSTVTPSGVEFVLFTGPQTSRPFLSLSAGMYREYGSPVQSSVWRALCTTPVGIVRQGIDVFHGLDHVGLPPFSKRSRYVVTIYDVIPLLFPHTFSLRHRLVVRAALARVCKQADMVIVLSQATKEDLLQHCRLPEDRVVVIPAACDARFNPTIDHVRLSRVRLKYGLPPLYILFLGTLNPRKNVTTLLQAFAQFHHMQQRADPPVHLVIAGASAWQTPGMYRTLQRLDLESVVHFPGFLDEEDLPDLYRGALLFVFPSLYEGFGLPVLEAMGCGVPVITSNVASLPEVAGDAAVLVDPYDVAGMAAALSEVVHNETLRRTLQGKGIAQAQKFSWDTAAKQTLELYIALGG